MTEMSAEQAKSDKGPTHPDEDKCPDPFGPYTCYRVNAEIAKKRQALFTADATAMATRYDRLAGAQQKYADAWAAQKKAWADLACELERIRKNLHTALDQAARKQLEDCWTSLRTETTEAAQPADCTEIVELDCKKLLEDVTKLSPDELAEALAHWRRQGKRAETCVSQADKAFGDLADFPDKLQGLITDLKSRADQIDNAESGDAQRGYVEYLALHHDFCELWNKLVTAAAYTCQLKYVFVKVLQTHQAWICLQVAIDGAEQRASFEDAAKQAKAMNLVDLVLECAMPAQPDDNTRPPGDCMPPPEQQTAPTQATTPTPKEAEGGQSAAG